MIDDDDSDNEWIEDDVNTSTPPTKRKRIYLNEQAKYSSLFNEFVCKLDLFWHEWASLKRSFQSRLP
jgi:hypothetical protein